MHESNEKPPTMKFSIIVFSSLIFILSISCKKNNPLNGNDKIKQINTSRPLTDFGSATYHGFQGGLYPNGSNQRPVGHNTAGLAIAKSIKPLSRSGAIDEANGKIVWMSIGMSNTTQETQPFLSLMQNYSEKNPKLVLIDGAQGGQDINAINSLTASYWNTVSNRLETANSTASQVQIIWFKEAEVQPKDTSFASYPDALKNKYKSVMQILKVKFPNLKLVYLSSRIYAGYATTKQNPEPFAWYNGWTVKRLIEDQINGDPKLMYSGDTRSSAWLSWGPYLWANGKTPRNDGLIWLPSDYEADGTHPSTTGRDKVAQMLFNFFTTDETTTPWFLKP